MEIFEKILNKYENKLIKSDCKALMKKCSFKSSRDMNILTELIDLMYLYRDYEMAIELYYIIENVEFTGNYTIYDEILYAKWTIVRIYRETNQIEKYNQLINSVMEYQKQGEFLFAPDSEQENRFSYGKEKNKGQKRPARKKRWFSDFCAERIDFAIDLKSPSGGGFDVFTRMVQDVLGKFVRLIGVRLKDPRKNRDIAGQ